MQITKRNGSRENVKFDKITARIQRLCNGLDKNYVDASSVAIKTIEGLYDGVTTEEIDKLAAENAATLTVKHPDYTLLAGRISMSNLHKNTKDSFSAVMSDMFHYTHPITGEHSPLITPELYQIVQQNAAELDSWINHQNDFGYDFFAFKTLERAYLTQIDDVIVERPQYLLLRVSLGIHGSDLVAAKETYQILSDKLATHATPTLFNAGTMRPQLSSCFLVAMKDDSLAGIYSTISDIAQISKWSGGIGVHVHNIRAKESFIKGTNGKSKGLLPMIKVLNETARYCDQGGQKRKGSFAVYLEPWHSDIFEFLDLKKNTGKEELRARDLFYALWIPDLFMRRVEESGKWSLMCPNECPGLSDTYGEEFEELYTRYEQEGKARSTIDARDLWSKILDSQIETGGPYMLYKDACNSKSNQKNLGVIKSSNLCCEVIQFSDKDDTSICNLASIALPLFLKKKIFDFQRLAEVSGILTRNLNKVIDVNFYPTEAARNSNQKHRPIGLGVQGLADLFALMGIPFDSPEAKALNKDIFEAIYYGALDASCRLAEEQGTYSSYEGSPVSQGVLQHDMWGVPDTDNFDWPGLRERIKEFGVRNSLLLAPMPTASTSQILGNNECFEPYTSNMYVRRVLSGEFVIVNKHLIKDLIKLDLWSEKMRQSIIAANGSVQGIAEIPDDIKAIYKTVWEIKQKDIIDMAADRGAYIDQSQSMNLFIADPNYAKLTSMHFYAWKKGLKTGMYYLRSKAAQDALKVTVDKEMLQEANPVESMSEEEQAALVCSLENPESCEACSG